MILVQERLHVPVVQAQCPFLEEKMASSPIEDYKRLDFEALTNQSPPFIHYFHTSVQSH